MLRAGANSGIPVSAVAGKCSWRSGV